MEVMATLRLTSTPTPSPLQGVAQMIAIYAMGVAVYSTRMPEAIAPSGVFDVLGSSRQWWHLAVVVAAIRHVHTVSWLWEEET